MKEFSNSKHTKYRNCEIDTWHENQWNEFVTGKNSMKRHDVIHKQNCINRKIQIKVLWWQTTLIWSTKPLKYDSHFSLF